MLLHTVTFKYLSTLYFNPFTISLLLHTVTFKYLSTYLIHSMLLPTVTFEYLSTCARGNSNRAGYFLQLHLSIFQLSLFRVFQRRRYFLQLHLSIFQLDIFNISLFFLVFLGSSISALCQFSFKFWAIFTTTGVV